MQPYSHQALTLFCLLAAAGIARADAIVITPDSSTLNLTAGSSATFAGAITNRGATPIDLNGIDITLSGMLEEDTDLFLVNAPFTLDPGMTTSIFSFFTVSAAYPYTDPTGPRLGVLSILGGIEGAAGYDPTAQNILGTISFTVDVEPVSSAAPELPSSIGFLTGVLLLFAARRVRGVDAHR